MPQIIPIKDLKNTSEVSELCRNSREPIFVTKNGYGDMVIMSIEAYERDLALVDIYRKVAVAEQQISNGEVMDAEVSLRILREKYGF